EFVSQLSLLPWRTSQSHARHKSRHASADDGDRSVGTDVLGAASSSGAADSRYNALAVELKRRFTRGFQFIAAYTLSDANDNRPDQTMVVVGADDAKGLQNNLDINADWGRSDLD